MKRKKFLGLVASLVVLANVVACTAEEEFVVNDIVVELGSGIDMEGFGFEHNEEDVTIDDSQVDYQTLGEYEAFYVYKGGEYPFTVIIEDTVPPTITVSEEIAVLEVDEEIDLLSVIETEDASGEVTVAIKEDAEETKLTVSYKESGTYTTTVVASDASGNTSEAEVEVKVAVAPTINGTKDITVTKDVEKVDYLSGIIASNELKEDISDDIEVNDSKVKLDTVGEYEVVYSVKDENGLSATETIKVTVKEKEVASTSTTTGTTSGSTSSNTSSNSGSSTSGSGSSSSGSTSSGSGSSSSGSSTSGSDSSTTTTPTERWGTFSSFTDIMSSADKSACDAIAKAYFKGEISMSSCKSQLQAYQDKYMEHYMTPVAIKGIGESVNQPYLSYLCNIYRAEQDYFYGDNSYSMIVQF